MATKNKKFYILAGFLLAGGIIFTVMAVTGANDINRNGRTNFSYGSVIRNSFASIFKAVGLADSDKSADSKKNAITAENNLDIADWMKPEDKTVAENGLAVPASVNKGAVVGVSSREDGNRAEWNPDSSLMSLNGGNSTPVSRSNFSVASEGGTGGGLAGVDDVSGSGVSGSKSSGKTSALGQLINTKTALAAGLKAHSAAAAKSAGSSSYSGAKANSSKGKKASGDYYNDKGLGSLDSEAAKAAQAVTGTTAPEVGDAKLVSDTGTKNKSSKDSSSSPKLSLGNSGKSSSGGTSSSGSAASSDATYKGTKEYTLLFDGSGNVYYNSGENSLLVDGTKVSDTNDKQKVFTSTPTAIKAELPEDMDLCGEDFSLIAKKIAGKDINYLKVENDSENDNFIINAEVKKSLWFDKSVYKDLKYGKIDKSVCDDGYFLVNEQDVPCLAPRASLQKFANSHAKMDDKIKSNISNVSAAGAASGSGAVVKAMGVGGVDCSSYERPHLPPAVKCDSSAKVQCKSYRELISKLMDEQGYPQECRGYHANKSAPSGEQAVKDPKGGTNKGQFGDFQSPSTGAVVNPWSGQCAASSTKS